MRKKTELIENLTHKPKTLQEANGSLLMDIKLNRALGAEVEALNSELGKPNEFDKYGMFLGALEPAAVPLEVPDPSRDHP